MGKKGNNDDDLMKIAMLAGFLSADKKKDFCYIATMVYGSYDAKEVTVLRRYRDEVLLKNWFGGIFVDFYYAVSPHIVKLLKNRKKVNGLIKIGLDKIVRYIELNKF
ncbi:MAG TPA: hypothetical protein PLW37_04330 [bacterium]|jgi:hypothetical protein|nr:hypothetical protein [bacterium]